MKRGRVAVAIVVAIVVVTATPVQAATTAVGSVHTTDSDFNAAAELTNVTVTGSGDAAAVELATGDAFFDGYESGSVSGYTGDTGPFATTTSEVYEGTYGVTKTSNDEVVDVAYTDTDQTSPGADKTASVWVYWPGEGSADRGGGSALVNGSGDGYVGYWDPVDGSGDSTFSLLTLTGGNYDSSLTNVQTGGLSAGYYKLHVRHDGTDAVSGWLEDENGNIVVGPINSTASAYDPTRPGLYMYDSAGTYDNLRLEGGGGGVESGTYISQNHSVEQATDGWTNLTLDNASATVTWEASSGGSWTDVATATYSTSGNYTQSLSGGYDTWRVNVTFEKTGSDPVAELHDEGVLFSNREPIVDNSSSSPSGGRTLNTTDPTLSIDINDFTFGTVQGDKLNISFYVDGSFEANQTVTTNGTVTQEVKGLTGGSHSWYVVANDSYGGSTTSQTFSFKTPDVLEIRNESQRSKLVDNVTTELRFYYEDEPIRIENKSTSTGTVDFTNLPTDRAFVLVADAPGYTPRRIYVDSLIESQQVYLLPESKQQDRLRFELQDLSGDYPDGPTVLKVQRAINGSWRTVEADYFGASGAFPTNLRHNVRHRLVLLNTNTGQRQIVGSYTPTGDRTEVVRVGSGGVIEVLTGGPIITANPQVRSIPATNSSTIAVEVQNNSNNVSSWSVTMTYGNGTQTTVLNQTSRNSQGGTYEPTLQLAGRGGGNVTVNVSYTLADGTTGYKEVVYSVSRNYSNGNSLLNGLASVPSRFPAQHASTVTGFMAVLVAIITSTAVAGVFRASTEVVGLVAVSVLAGFALIGWVGYGPVFVGGATWVALSGIRRGV